MKDGGVLVTPCAYGCNKPLCRTNATNPLLYIAIVEDVGLLDGAMHVWADLYRATRTKTLCLEGSHWNRGE